MIQKAAKAATATIPIVFISGADPVKAGIVTSLNRPGGNVTGVSLLGTALETKRLGLLNEIVPGTASIGVLVNPGYPDIDHELHELREAASAIKRQINVVHASTEAEIDTAFATLLDKGRSRSLLPQMHFFAGRLEQLVALAARYKLPAIYVQREFAEAGGLASYGTDYCSGITKLDSSRKGSQGCQTSRSAGHAADQVRAGDQPQDRQNTRPQPLVWAPQHR